MIDNIIYYDELEFNNKYIYIYFKIKLNEDNKDIFIDKIDFEYKDENNKSINISYNINFTLKLGIVYHIMKVYYDIINYYKYPLSNNLSINMVLFGYDYIEDFLMICKIKEKEFFNNKRISIFKHQLNRICDILNYHIFKGLDELNIYNNNDYNKTQYNNLINKLNKYLIIE